MPLRISISKLLQSGRYLESKSLHLGYDSDEVRIEGNNRSSSDAGSDIVHEHEAKHFRPFLAGALRLAFKYAQGKLRANSAQAKNPYDEANEGIILGTLRRNAPQRDMTS